MIYLLIALAVLVVAAAVFYFFFRAFAERELSRLTHGLDEVRQEAIAELARLTGGPHRVLKMPGVIARLVVRDFEGVAKELLATSWAQTALADAHRLAEVFRTGKA